MYWADYRTHKIQRADIDGAGWVETTTRLIDTTNNVICGDALSLSLFAVMEESPEEPSVGGTVELLVGGPAAPRRGHGLAIAAGLRHAHRG